MGLQVKRLNDTVNQLKAQMNSDIMEPHGGKYNYNNQYVNHNYVYSIQIFCEHLLVVSWAMSTSLLACISPAVYIAVSFNLPSYTEDLLRKT